MIWAEALDTLADLPAYERLGRHVIMPENPLLVGDLRLWLEELFIPERVGSSEGTRERFLRGALLPSYEVDGPLVGVNCARSGVAPGYRHEQSCGRYRWTVLVTELHEGRECVEVLVDRLASPRNLAAAALAPGESRAFWLCSFGVQTLELEPPNGKGFFDYHDYVEISLGVHPSAQGGDPWSAGLRARRVVRGYQTLSADCDLLVGRPSSLKLGDHRIDVLAMTAGPGSLVQAEGLVGKPRPELSVQLRLARGWRLEGLLPEPPPPTTPPLPTAGRPLQVGGLPRRSRLCGGASWGGRRW